jgi:hypothetical protein
MRVIPPKGARQYKDFSAMRFPAHGFFIFANVILSPSKDL